MVIIDLPKRKYCSSHKCYFKLSLSNCPLCSSKEKDSQLNLTNNSRTITNNSRRVYVKKRIVERFHAYRVKFVADVNWEALFQYEERSLNNNVKFKSIYFDEAIVRVFRKSILITIRSSKEVKGLSVKEAKARSDELVSSVLTQLPKAIKVKDNGNTSSVHNAFINHPLAKLNTSVKVNDEVRFISDNSKGNSEFEAINTNHAISDSEAIEQDIVSLIDKGLSRDYLAHALNELIKDRYFHAENMRTHVEAIQSLSEGVKELKDQVISISPKNNVREEYIANSCTPLFSNLNTFSKYDLERKNKIKKFIDEYR